MFVIDASIVASWALPDESNPTSDAAYRRLAGEAAIAPALLWFELRNVLLTGERHNRIGTAETTAFLALFRDLPIQIDRFPDEAAAFGLARTHRLTFYDAAYLELAQRRSLPLATLDEALIKAARAEQVAPIGAG